MMMPDAEKLNNFMNKFVVDLGAALHAGMVVVGDKLGLYKALAPGPLTSKELSQKTGTDERYVREWLNSQAAGGYVEYDRKSHKYSLTPEQAFALAVEDSPAFIPGAFVLATGALAAVERLTTAFKTGEGIGWHEHQHGVFEGCAKFFRPGYAANLVSTWLPALQGAEAKLHAGARVADVGCGYGTSTILMAQAYPKSQFFGFDYHEDSIRAAREGAARAGIGDRVHFEVARAKDYPGKDYDLVTVFDCLHDLGDPVGASRHILDSLSANGHFMIVEPFAHDDVADNLNPVGRVFYAGSTLLCTPCSRSQEVGLCLGAQAGEARIQSVLDSAGFRRFRRAAETPFNLVYEARP
jgi:SAM-dependent methyltransferase